MPSIGSIDHPFAPPGAGEGAPTPQRTNFRAQFAYFAIFSSLVRTLFLVMSSPIFSPSHNFVRPNAPPQLSKTLLKGVYLCSPPLK